MRDWSVHTEIGFRRLVNFSDAVVAIAITLLILPLVDTASSIGDVGVATFFHHNDRRLLAFLLSFAVIGRYWWGEHQMFERAKSYNTPLVASTFLWLLSIVFLPFPTELLSEPTPGSGAAYHALYVGTLLVASLAGFLQQLTLLRCPELVVTEQQGRLDLTNASLLVVLMTAAFIFAVFDADNGLWGLLLLALSGPLEWLVERGRPRARRDRARA